MRDVEGVAQRVTFPLDELCNRLIRLDHLMLTKIAEHPRQTFHQRQNGRASRMLLPAMGLHVPYPPSGKRKIRH